ncbi:ABC transporter ATP-binding protein [Niallia sp. JL1B1071]|uniref:ABC transporter ATP-binding protein n=1 Tax=Niallia tiangongensis TaxID=3237105 RepID=UPI0037DD7457
MILNGITKKYNDNSLAVNNLNLEIEKGEFLVLVGPSGCGKTTTLRLIAGLEKISEGTLVFNDQIINELSPGERKIGMVFQSYALYPHKNVYENLAFGLRKAKVPKDNMNEMIQHTAKMLGLDGLLKRKPKHLSGGQRQRVALARAIVKRPDIFLFDEPLSNLDASLRVSTRKEISKLHQQLQSTMVYVTHDQVEAMTLGTRIAVMNKGKLEQIDTPANIYKNPKNTFVASFIGTPPMNLLHGNVGIKDKVPFVTLSKRCWNIPKDKAEKLSEYDGQVVIVGIRPEDLFLTTKGNEHLTGIIETLEYLGSETVIFCKTDVGDVLIRLEGYNHLKIGDTVQIGLTLEKLHFFDSVKEENIFN